MSEDRVPTGGKRHLAGLQMARGIAAVMVVADHAIVHMTPGDGPAFAHLFGLYGVTIFFLLSGFLMVRVSGAGRFRPGSFMLHRLERVVPLYYLANAILIAQLLIAPWAFKTTRLDVGHIMHSLLFIPSYVPGSTDGSMAPFYKLGWTLNYEMFFYLAFASLFALRSSHRVVLLTIAFSLLMILGHMVHFNIAIAAYYTQLDLGGFLIGAWLGLLAQQGRIRISGPGAMILAITSVALFCVALLHYQDEFGKTLGVRIPMLALATCHMLIIVGYLDRLNKAIHPLLLRLGNASYSIYLFHMFAIGPIALVGKRLGPAFLAPTMIAALIGGTVAGLIVHRLAEQPIIDFFKRRRASARNDVHVSTQADMA